ncbi:hypothetical protein [Faecalibaculum rodentium]|nr:hypothetical protein [Faecalibaculum rodentium]
MKIIVATLGFTVLGGYLCFALAGLYSSLKELYEIWTAKGARHARR